MTGKETSSGRRYHFEQFTAIRRYQGNLAFSPDGSQIAYITNTSGQFNLWRQPTAGGYPRQLTVFEDRTVRGIAWSPDGTRIAFHADQHGDEFHQLYVVDAVGGWPEALTDTMDAQHMFSPESWSPDGRRLAWTSNDRQRTDMDVVAYDLTSGETTRPLAGDALYAFASWSPDGRYLLCVDVKGNIDQNLLLVDLTDGSSRVVTPHAGEVIYYPGPWARDGSGFYLITDQDREFKGAAFYSLSADRWDWVETPEWDIEDGDLSDDGRYLAWLINEQGFSRLVVRDLTHGDLLNLPELPLGAISNLTFSPDGRLLGFYLTTSRQCMDVYVMDLAEGELRQLTFGMLGGIDPQDLIDPELVSFRTFDGREIPGWLYRPRGAGKAPVVLSIHGGPEAQERPAYMYAGLYQYLLNRGIGVLAPNIRGSTGYGKTYQKLIHRDWGGGELKDIEAAAQYLQSLDWVDRRRMAVFGGSFGGFATLSAVSRLPDYWAAAVDIVGPSNLMTFVQSVPPFWRRLMETWVGDPEKDRDLLVERSPITYQDQIKAPLFIIQGANDPRVVKAESDQMVEKLRERGVEVRYDVYEDEGHGFTKRENELKALGDSARFLEEHLQ